MTREQPGILTGWRGGYNRPCQMRCSPDCFDISLYGNLRCSSFCMPYPLQVMRVNRLLTTACRSFEVCPRPPRNRLCPSHNYRQTNSAVTLGRRQTRLWESRFPDPQRTKRGEWVNGHQHPASTAPTQSASFTCHPPPAPRPTYLQNYGSLEGVNRNGGFPLGSIPESEHEAFPGAPCPHIGWCDREAKAGAARNLRFISFFMGLCVFTEGFATW